MFFKYKDSNYYEKYRSYLEYVIKSIFLGFMSNFY